MSKSDHDITGLLTAASGGDRKSQEELFREVESHLRRIAHEYLRGERPDHSQQTTALVNDAFMRLIVDGDRIDWADRSHFYRTAARAMRRLLVDHARTRERAKRGGGEVARADIDIDQLYESAVPDLLALDEALKRLEHLDPRQCEVVELHHFCRYSLKDTAEILGVSESTVKKDWKAAKAWLYREIADENDES